MSEGEPTTTAERDLAAAVHETTNALTVILGWIERARAASAPDSEAGRSLLRASRYARSARDQMRRAIGAQIPAQPPEPVADLVARLCEDLSREAQERSITLRPHIAADTARLAAVRPHAAWQILTNLLLNAIALSQPNSSVEIHASCGDSGVRFRVSDEGPGIDPDIRPTLFTAPTSKRRGGTGIGLRHAHALAAELGGKLSLLDTEQGASFELSWRTTPITDATSSNAPPPSVSGKKPTGLQGARVLLLEDDAAIIELLELSLSARGADVTSVDTKTALYQALEEAPPDVVLMDLSPLQGALGDALERARQRNPDVSCIVVSGSVTMQPRQDVLWVRKPFEPRELVNAILRERQRDNEE